MLRAAHSVGWFVQARPHPKHVLLRQAWFGFDGTPFYIGSINQLHTRRAAGRGGRQVKRLIAVVTILTLAFSLAAVAQAAGEKPAQEKAKMATAAHPLDINTATKEELAQVPGLEAYADKIIASRPYKTKSELVNRSIIPMVVYDKVKDRLVTREAKPAGTETAAPKEKVEKPSGMPSVAHPLDINTATKEELAQVPGLEAYADKIISSRPYKTKSELVNRSIVPRVVYDKIKDRLTIK